MADKINYVSGDYDSIKTELFAKLQSLPAWKDVQNENSIGNTFIRLYAYLGDLLFYKMNKLTNESYLQTVEIKDNILKIIKMLNYVPRKSTGSHGTVTFSINSAHYNNIIIPQGTLIRSSGGISFYTIKEYELVIGDTSVDCKVIQGLQRESYFKGDGTTNQEYYINIDNKDYYVGEDVFKYQSDEFKAIKLYVNNTEWTNIDNLIASEPTDKVYIVESFNDYGVKIRFGDGTFGAVPALNDDIKVIYNVNIGVAGNVNSEDITTIETSIYDSALSLQTLTVTNKLAYINGGDPETVEEIRYNAPKYFASGDRGITKEDFEAMIEKDFANILDINIWAEEDKTPPNFKLYNQVNICLLIDDGNGNIVDPDVDGLNYNSYYDEIDDVISAKRSITVWRKYHVPKKVSISLKINYKKLSKYISSDIESSIQSAINSYFVEHGYLGNDINHSDIVNLIDSITGVDYCFVYLKKDISDLGYNVRNISIDENEYPSLNNIVFIRE